MQVALREMVHAKSPIGGGLDEGTQDTVCIPWGLAWSPLYKQRFKGIFGIMKILVHLVKSDRVLHVSPGDCLLVGDVLAP